MHLIYSRVGVDPSSVYKVNLPLARPYTLAHFFRGRRISRNLTKRALAEKFSLSEDYVSMVESGLRFPSVGYCLSCAQEFGVNPEWVKREWVKEMVSRFHARLNKRLEIED